jgi:hypothetical protein
MKPSLPFAQEGSGFPLPTSLPLIRTYFAVRASPTATSNRNP